ncbi:MAG: alpha/beta hydrolase, partial [Pseudomonadota bacterium]
HLSDKPADVTDYAMDKLHGDISAVIDDLNAEQVTLVGHDWGGAICWQYAMAQPERISKLVIMNLTHPRGYAAVVADATPAQAENVAYAKRFASSTPGDDQVPEQVLNAGERRGDRPEVAARYRAAFEQSSWNGMMNYYRANYGSLLGVSEDKETFVKNIDRPVLQLHGLEDTAVDKDGLRDTWNWIGRDYTLVTVPDAGHFVQWDAAELVSETMKWWLLARP